jgi:hypothetical protein
MLKITTFKGHTISALPLLSEDARWTPAYVVCHNGVLVQRGRPGSSHASHQAAEIAGVLYGIQYVRERLLISTDRELETNPSS